MRALLLLMAALAAGAPASRGGVFEHEEGRVLIWFPDNWNVDIEEGLLAASSVDGDARVELVSLKGAADLDAAGESGRARLAQRIRQWRETEARHDASLGGMAGFTFGGEGVQGGIRHSVRAIIFKAPGQYLMLTWSAERTRAPQLAGTWDRIAASVKPGRAPR